MSMLPQYRFFFRSQHDDKMAGIASFMYGKYVSNQRIEACMVGYPKKRVRRLLDSFCILHSKRNIWIV
jgi:hypothetical protein